MAGFGADGLIGHEIDNQVRFADAHNPIQARLQMHLDALVQGADTWQRKPTWYNSSRVECNEPAINNSTRECAATALDGLRRYRHAQTPPRLESRGFYDRPRKAP